MTTKTMESRELIDRWMVQQLINGQTNEELSETLFVYGDEAATLRLNDNGSLRIEREPVKKVVAFRRAEEASTLNMCRACGMDHSSYKEALECCAHID